MKKCLNPGPALPNYDLSRNTAISVLPSSPSNVAPVSLVAAVRPSVAAGYPAGVSAGTAPSSFGSLELPAAIREKLKLVSFISILVVLFIHAIRNSLVYGGVTMKQPSAFAEFFFHLSTESFGRVNRPLFFSISGYLFFWTLKPELSGFVEKWKSRLRSLVVPYLAWSLIGFVGFRLVCQTDFGRGLLGHKISLVDSNWVQMIRTVLWDPIPYQLWYIRDLCALILLSPLIYLGTRFLGWWLAAGVIVGWFNGWLPQWPDETGVAFFTLGAIVATRRVVPQWNLDSWLAPSLCVWTLACIMNSALHMQGITAPGIIKLGSATGLVSVWALVDRIRSIPRRYMSQAAAFTFFIYAAHEPLMGGIRQSLFKVVPFNGATLMASSLILPLVTLAICLCAGVVLRSRFPGAYGFLTGGRGQIPPLRGSDARPRQVRRGSVFLTITKMLRK